MLSTSICFDCLILYWRPSPNLSGYLKGHSCFTALLKMTQDWRASLDRREAVDLSKAFDSVRHPLLLAKLKAYGFTADALGNMAAYLLGRRQKEFKLKVFILSGEL